MFTPKYHRKVIYGALRAEIGKILRELCRRKDVEIIEAHAMPDHIHILVSIPPNERVSSFMGYLKGKSTMIIFERYAHLKYKEEKNMYFLERPKNVTAIKSKFIAEIRKKAMRGGKSGSRSPAGQWDGSAAAALSRLLVGLFARGVRLASAPEREARG